MADTLVLPDILRRKRSPDHHKAFREFLATQEMRARTEIVQARHEIAHLDRVGFERPLTVMEQDARNAAQRICETQELEIDCVSAALRQADAFMTA
jgi:hypothetical protein